MTAYFTGPAVAWGPGAVEQLSGLGLRRAFVLVDPAVARVDGARRVLEELEKIGAAVETSTDAVDPDHVPSLNLLRESVRQLDPDGIVAVGGGRTIDAAKGVRLAFECPELSLDETPALLPLPERPRSQLVAIPTTSGSGAEASWTADLVRSDGTLLEISDRRLVPDWALVDPTFASSTPPSEIVPQALEVAALAAEAYLSAWSNPFSDALALDAVATVVRRLPHAVKWSDDPDARSAVHYAATGAGLAASNAQRGIAHALARALVTPTGLAYATLVGILLPYALEFDRPAARDRVEILARAAASPDDRAATPLSGRLRKLYETLRFPASLPAAGVPAERLASARKAVIDATLRSPAILANPRVPSAADVAALLDAVSGQAPERGPTTP
ncbi:MAG: iron-containing alcohol dehydrogenase [Thermoplasmata archaeon]